jgi:hypothetical protein
MTTPHRPAAQDDNTARSRWLSVIVGIGAAAVISLVGPVYGAPVLICAVALAFLTLSRFVFGSETVPAWDALLIAAGLSWFGLLPFAPIVHAGGRDPTPSEWVTWVGIGAAPLVLGLLLSPIAGIKRGLSRDIDRR